MQDTNKLFVSQFYVDRPEGENCSLLNGESWKVLIFDTSGGRWKSTRSSWKRGIRNCRRKRAQRTKRSFQKSPRAFQNQNPLQPNVVAQVASMPPFQPPVPFTAPATSTPRASPTTTASSATGTSSTSGGIGQQVARPGAENWFSTYDWLIAFVVLAIAALVYRRFSSWQHWDSEYNMDWLEETLWLLWCFSFFIKSSDPLLFESVNYIPS